MIAHEPEAPALDKRSMSIRAMFAGVAPRYDFLNHLLSGSLDCRWRERAARELTLPQASRVLDVASGTGDLAIELARQGQKPVGVDFCFEMLFLGKQKRSITPIPFVTADALTLPFRSSAFDGATVAFGVRNFESRPQGLAELARVVRPGGRIAILEFTPPPPGFVGRIVRFHVMQVVPRVGALLSPRGSAYAYLSTSIAGFPSPDDFTRELEDAGFEQVSWTRLGIGSVALHVATRSAD